MRTTRWTFLRPYVFGSATFAMLLVSAAAAETPQDINQPPEGAQRSKSGFLFQVLEAGDGGARPDGNDFVTVQYTAYRPDGAKFESTYDRGQPASFFVDRAFPAWQDNLPAMLPGEKRRIWVPEQGGNAVFDLELLGFVPIPEPPAALMQAPQDAQKTSFGAFTKVISKPENGTAYTDEGGVMTSYTLWSAEGKVLESSFARRRPTLLPLDRLMPALSDILKNTVIGEKLYAWIPESVHQGNWPGRPKGLMIFEIEVMQFVDMQPRG